jgi:hypothetical protein
VLHACCFFQLETRSFPRLLLFGLVLAGDLTVVFEEEGMYVRETTKLGVRRCKVRIKHKGASNLLVFSDVGEFVNLFRVIRAQSLPV